MGNDKDQVRIGCSNIRHDVTHSTFVVCKVQVTDIVRIGDIGCAGGGQADDGHFNAVDRFQGPGRDTEIKRFLCIGFPPDIGTKIVIVSLVDALCQCLQAKVEFMVAHSGGVISHGIHHLHLAFPLYPGGNGRTGEIVTTAEHQEVTIRGIAVIFLPEPVQVGRTLPG